MQTSRRDFLKTSATVSAATLASLGFSSVQAAENEPLPDKWDMSADVVVGGSGAAGMSAAINALDKGCEVIVFEKENYGGCAYVCGGILNLQGGTKLQKSQGSTDTPEAYFKRLTNPRNPVTRKNDWGLAKKISELSPKLQEFLEERGVTFYDYYQSNTDTQHTGTYHTVKWTEPGEARVKAQPDGSFMTGLGIMIPLRKYYEGKGGKLLLGHKLTKVYKSPEGVVVGALIETTDGKKINVQAKKGVVLAGGSWKADVELRKISDIRFTEHMFSSGFPYVSPDGSAVLAGLAAGGFYMGSSGFDEAGQLRRKFGTSRYNWKKGSKYGFPGMEIGGKRWNEVIFTNKSGDRFVAEVDTSYKPGWFYDIALVQPEQKLFVIYDDETAKKFRIVPDDSTCEPGYAFKADTIEELAKVSEQPNLVETVKRYNGFVQQKKDEDFDRPEDTMVKTIEKGPFYAVRCVLGIHNLAGGLWVDENSRVLDKDGKPIKGLYAAGESAGCIQSFGVPRALLTGQIAGMHIATL